MSRTEVALHPAFAAYFKALDQARPTPPKRGPKSGVTKVGATGVEPGLCAPSLRAHRSLASAPWVMGS